MALGAQGLARNQGTGHVRAWLAPLMACLPLSWVTHAVIRPGGLGLVLALCVVAPGAARGECQSCEEGQLHFVLTGGGH